MAKKKVKSFGDYKAEGSVWITLTTGEYYPDSRPLPDEALCAVLWEYKDRGKKGYDLTEKFFPLMRRKFPSRE